MNAFCRITSLPQDPWFWYFVAECIIGAFVVFLVWNLVRILIQIKPKGIVWPLSILMSVIFFFILSGFSFVIFFLLFFHDDHPPSENYHVLNAAIKNTCLLDPSRKNCPQTAQDIIDIQPLDFSLYTKDAHLTYQYYPQSNQYTLIVRDNDLYKDDNRVVVFDPRLTTVKNYGSGVDFIDTGVMRCGGKYQLVDPPPFSGPWNDIN